MEKKIQKLFIDSGFGFPVTLVNVPMIKVRGEWLPEINQLALKNHVIAALASKPSRLTGAEIRFIRLSAEMTLTQFAERFDVTHPAVMKWEKSESMPTGMNWTTEKDIRLFALTTVSPKPKEFIETYSRLTEVAPKKSLPIKIDLHKKSA